MKRDSLVVDYERLKRCFLFKGASVATVDEAFRSASFRIYSKGSVIYDDHDYSRELGLVLSGRVEVTKGEDFVMNTLVPGSIFGAAAIFNDSKNYVTRLTAADPCRIMFLSQGLLTSLMRKDFTVAESYISFLTSRICFLNNKIGGLLLSGSEASLRNWLCQNVQQDGSSFYVQVPSFTKLAATLNISRSSLYRSFEELESAGMLIKRGKRITVPDPAALTIEED